MTLYQLREIVGFKPKQEVSTNPAFRDVFMNHLRRQGKSDLRIHEEWMKHPDNPINRKE